MNIVGLNMDLRDRSKWVAIIGSREASKKEMEVAYKLAYKCAKEGKIVVSGLAKGIDTAGHEGALAGGGKTIAIVSTTVNSPIYPSENKNLAERIKENGCIIHPFLTRPVKGQNVKRLIERSILNAILCPNIVVVKDADTIITGGTKWATYYGMNVFKHDVYRLDCNFKFHKNPEVEECRPWWIREINPDTFLYKLDSLSI